MDVSHTARARRTHTHTHICCAHFAISNTATTTAIKLLLGSGLIDKIVAGTMGPTIGRHAASFVIVVITAGLAATVAPRQTCKRCTCHSRAGGSDRRVLFGILVIIVGTAVAIASRRTCHTCHSWGVGAVAVASHRLPWLSKPWSQLRPSCPTLIIII